MEKYIEDQRNSIPQLDFLGGYLPPRVEEQYEIFDGLLSVVDYSAKPDYTGVEPFFVNINPSLVGDYTGYWTHISPKDLSEVFKRFLFAFMSVHTSWKANVTGYKAIENWWEWINNATELQDRLVDSRVGMQNNRAKYLNTFATSFWKNPKFYSKGDNETWVQYRDRLERVTLGLGKAKTSFAIEMCYPNETNVVCLDTHMFQAYGLDQTKHARQYADLERHWVEMSKMWNIPPYIARCLYWDAKQGQNSSQYWSHVFEKQKT